MAYEVGVAYLSVVPTFKGLSSALTSANKDITKGLGNAGAAAGEQAGGLFAGSFGKLMKGGAIVASVAALGAAAGAAFSGTFGEAMERQASTAKASAQLGLSEKDSKALGASAGKLYSQAYGESFGDVTDALSVVKSSLKGLGAADLEGATKKALSFSQAFDVDMTRSVQSVNTLLQSGLAKNSTEAFDLITAASQKVPAQLREDVLDASDEYSQFFNALGFDGSQAFGALTAASDKGVFGIDKTGDAIKEFTIRATDMSASTTGAFSSIGLDAQTMANQILAGGDTAQGATQKIVDGLLGIQDPATQANTAIALFGTPIEDLGVQNIPAFLSSLQSATGGLGDFTGAAAEVDKKLGGTLESKFTGLTRTLGGLGPTIATAFLPVLGPVLDGLTGIASKAADATKSAGDKISGFMAGLSGDIEPGMTAVQKQYATWGTSLADAVKGPLNTIKSYAQDFGAAIKTIITGDFDPSQWFAAPSEDSGLVSFLLSIRDIVMEVFSAIGPIVKEFFAAIGPVLKEVGATLGPAFVDVFKSLQPAISQLLPVFTQLLPLFNPVGLLFKALLPVLPQIATLVAEVARMLGEFLGQALTALTPLFQAIVGVIGELIPFISQLVASLLPPLMSLFDSLAPLLQAVLGALLPLITSIASSLIPVIQALMPIVKTVFEFLATSIGNAITVFKGFIEFFTGIFTGDWGKAWDGIKKIFGGIWDQIKNILSTAVDLIVQIVTGLGPKVLDIVQSFFGFMVEKGSEFLGWLWDGIKTMAENVFGWFLSLPGWLWDRVFAALAFITAKGAEFLSWLWQGIKDKAVELFAWFASLPGWVWDKVVAFTGWLVEKGRNFIGWIAEGIADGAKAIWDFFADLPGKAWDALKRIASSIIDIGKGFVGFIIDGIGQVAGQIWDAIKAALTGDWGSADPGKVKVNDLGVQLGGARGAVVPGGARGAIVPGRDPGRFDNVLGVLPNGKPFGLRSEEAIMVPEFTHEVGGAPGVYALNRMAEAGRLSEVMGLAGGYATGGVAGLAGRLAQVGADGAWKAAKELISNVKDGSAGGFAGNGQWGPANFNGFAANTQAAKTYIEGHFPGVASIGGLYGGSVPGSDHPAGKALDVMIANYLSQAGIQNGTRIADWFIQNPNSFGTKYVIWRDRINQGGQWSPYSHPSGNNDTLQHRDHVHISFLTGGGEFAGGATNPVGDVGNGIAGLAQTVAQKLGFGFGGDTTGADTTGGSGVERWRSTALAALSAAGQPAGYVDSLLKQMMQESSGNPNAVQGTDINAQRGDPSVGLMQVIGSTFRDTLNSHGFGAYVGKGQTDPFSNILASILYTVDRYGSLGYWARNGYGAYDNGGMLGPNSVGVNLLNKPEAVLTPKQTAAYQAHAASLADGYGGRVVINLDSSDPLQVAVGRMIADGVDSGIVELASDIRRGRLQPTS